MCHSVVGGKAHDAMNASEACAFADIHSESTRQTEVASMGGAQGAEGAESKSPAAASVSEGEVPVKRTGHSGRNFAVDLFVRSVPIIIRRQPNHNSYYVQVQGTGLVQYLDTTGELLEFIKRYCLCNPISGDK